MDSVKTSKAPTIDKSNVDYNWTLAVRFRVRVPEKRRAQIAEEKNCTILSAIEMGSAERAMLMVAKGHPEYKNTAHHVMCCVLVPKDGRKRKIVLAEAIKHFESYKKEIFGVQVNGTAVAL